MASFDAATIMLLAAERAPGTIALVDRVALDLDQRARCATQLDAALRDARVGVATVAEGLAAIALAYSIQLSPRSLRGVVLRARLCRDLRAPTDSVTYPRRGCLCPRSPSAARAGMPRATSHSPTAWGRFVPEHQQACVVAADAVEARLLDMARAELTTSPRVATIPDTVVPIRSAV